MKKKEYIKPNTILYKVELESFIAESSVNPEFEGPVLPKPGTEEDSENATCAKKYKFSLWDEW